MTLTEFLTARLDEDEAWARGQQEVRRAQALAARSAFGVSHLVVGDRLDPARVLAEVAAKRAIVELAQHVENFEGGGAAIVMRDGYRAVPPGFGGLPGILPLLASVYSTHPDYQANWA